VSATIATLSFVYIAPLYLGTVGTMIRTIALQGAKLCQVTVADLPHRLRRYAARSRVNVQSTRAVNTDVQDEVLRKDRSVKDRIAVPEG
jgi:hypothetical protein